MKHLKSVLCPVLAAVPLWAVVCRAAEFEVVDVLRVDGYAVLQSSADIAGNRFSVGGSTLSAQYGKIGIGTSTPSFLLHVSSAAGAAGNLLVISTGSSNVIRMTGAGEIYANRFMGDGSGLTGITAGDNLGSHIATTTLNMATFNIVSVGSITANAAITTYSSMTVAGNLAVSTIIAAGNISAAAYQINGSMALSLTGGADSIAVGVYAGTTSTAGQNVFLGKNAGTSNTTGAYNTFLGYNAGVNNTIGTQNIFVGSAGGGNTSGSYNAFMGWAAGGGNTTGSFNVFIGRAAGSQNTSGVYNTFLGNGAGSWNATGGNNTFVGNEAGAYNQTGWNNAVVGYWAGHGAGVNSFSSSTLVGYQAGYGIQAGTAGHLFLGDRAGYNNASGLYNSFLGTYAGYTNVAGNNNSFLGYQAGYNDTADNNTFLGYQAGYTNAGGLQNSSMGSQAGYYNITGSNNSSFGYYAGYNTQTGSANAIFGNEAGLGATGHSFSSSTLMGYRAGYSLRNGSADNIFLGFQAGYAVTTGTGNIVIGYQKDTSAPGANNELNIGGVLYGDLSAKTIGISTRNPQAALDVVSTGTAQTQFVQIWRAGGGVIKSSVSATGVMMAARFIGDGSGLTSVPGDNLGNHTATQQLNMGNYAVWSSSDIMAARYQINGSTVLAVLPGTDSLGVGNGAGRISTADGNVFVGQSAGYATTSGAVNTFVGSQAGYFNTTGANNSFLGYGAGYNNTTGNFNSFLGYAAGYYNSAGWYNSFLSYGSGYSNSTGWNNSVVGAFAGYYNQTGSANVLLGFKSGGYGSGGGNSFSSSTIVGYQAGYKLANTASDNIFLGWQAGYNVTTGTGNIVIGYAADTTAPAASNQLNIGGLIYGDMSAGTVGISSAAPSGAKLVVQNGGDGKPGLQLITTGSKPACGETYRGAFFNEAGGAGVTDKVYVCLKMSTDAYQWVLVARGD